jgi:hypothetical protein
MSFLLNFEQLNAYLFRCSGDHDENTIPVTLGNSLSISQTRTRTRWRTRVCLHVLSKSVRPFLTLFKLKLRTFETASNTPLQQMA